MLFLRLALKIALLALVASSLPGCARRSTEPLVAPAAEKHEHPRSAGHEPLAQAVCQSLAQAPDQQACTLITAERYFDTPALAQCANSAGTDPAHTLACLRATASRHYTARSLGTCAKYSGDDEIECLEILADRRLSAEQVAQCRGREGTAAQLRCLARARDNVFDLELLYAIAKRSAAAPPALWPNDGSRSLQTVRDHNQSQMQALLLRTRREVEATFPTAVLESPDDAMLWNFAGGALAHYRMLYCSRREYLILFGTPIGAGGFSGRYKIDVHDWTLTGQMRTHLVGDVTPTIMEPGSWAKLMAGDTKIYTADPNTYMLEYARGRIVTAFDFGVTAPRRSISRDRKNMRGQIRRCLDGAIANESRQRRRMRRLRAQARDTRSAIDRQLRDADLADRLP